LFFSEDDGRKLEVCFYSGIKEKGTSDEETYTPIITVFQKLIMTGTFKAWDAICILHLGVAITFF
jgi:hypothetical protein